MLDKSVELATNPLHIWQNSSREIREVLTGVRFDSKILYEKKSDYRTLGTGLLNGCFDITQGTNFQWYPEGKLTKTNNPSGNNSIVPEHLVKYVEVYKHMLMKFKHKLSYLFSLIERREQYLEEKKKEEAEKIKKINAKKRYARKKRT